MREADALIGGFVAETIQTMDEPELDELEGVLDLPDPDLLDWLAGRKPVPGEHDGPVLRAMLAWAKTRRRGAHG